MAHDVASGNYVWQVSGLGVGATEWGLGFRVWQSKAWGSGVGIWG